MSTDIYLGGAPFGGSGQRSTPTPWEALKGFGAALYDWWKGPDPSEARLAEAHRRQQESIQARQQQASVDYSGPYGPIGPSIESSGAGVYFHQAQAAAKNALAQYRAALRHHLSQALGLLGSYAGIGSEYLQKEAQDMADFIAASTQAGMSAYDAGKAYASAKLAEMLSAQRQSQLQPMVYHVGVPPAIPGPETRRETLATDIVSPMEMLQAEGESFGELMDAIRTAYGERGAAQERAADEYVKALREAFSQYSAREAGRLQTLAGMKEAEAAYNTGALLAQLAAQQGQLQAQMSMAAADPLLGLKKQMMELDIAQQKYALGRAMEQDRMFEILGLADALGRPGLTEEEFNRIKQQYLEPFLADPNVSASAKFTLQRIFDEYWARRGNVSFRWIAENLFSTAAGQK